MIIKENGDRKAYFNDHMTHRYAIIEIWNMSRPSITWVGLNPSMANERDDDPTIRRIIDFSKRWGYGGFNMLNLFSQITPHPKELRFEPSVDQNFNRLFIENHTDSDNVVFAWGTSKQAKIESEWIINEFEEAKTLGLNLDGSPKHPLFVGKHTKLKLYREELEKLKHTNEMKKRESYESILKKAAKELGKEAEEDLKNIRTKVKKVIKEGLQSIIDKLEDDEKTKKSS